MFFNFLNHIISIEESGGPCGWKDEARKLCRISERARWEGEIGIPRSHVTPVLPLIHGGDSLDAIEHVLDIIYGSCKLLSQFSPCGMVPACLASISSQIFAIIIQCFLEVEFSPRAYVSSEKSSSAWRRNCTTSARNVVIVKNISKQDSLSSLVTAELSWQWTMKSWQFLLSFLSIWTTRRIASSCCKTN